MLAQYGYSTELTLKRSDFKFQEAWLSQRSNFLIMASLNFLRLSFPAAYVATF